MTNIELTSIRRAAAELTGRISNPLHHLKRSGKVQEVRIPELQTQKLLDRGEIRGVCRQEIHQQHLMHTPVETRRDKVVEVCVERRPGEVGLLIEA